MNSIYYELRIKPDVYYELFLDLVQSLTDFLEEYNEEIIIRSEDKEEIDNIILGIKEFQKELSIAFNSKIECNISLEEKNNQDWIKVYQENIKSIDVGEFFIHPSWEEDKDNKINIQIDPTLSFGSGHHESTYNSLLMISKYTKKDSFLVDVGTGSGILAIAGAKKGAIVDICDTDKVAIEDSIKNFKENNVEFNNAWVGSLKDSSEKYDIIVANIVADILVILHNEIKNHLKENAIIILSGILDKYLDKIKNKYKDFQIIEQIQTKEWVTLVLKEKNERK